jgi:uncharacterized protein YkwD
VGIIKKTRQGKTHIGGFYVRFLRIDFYKLFLNLLVLALFGFIIWSAIQLFSGKFLNSPLIGSIVFFIEIISFIFLCIHFRANSWRPPNIVITALVLIAMTIIMTFAGVQPLSGYKDTVISNMNAYFAEQEQLAEQIAIEQQELAEQRQIEEENRIAEEKAEMEAAKVTKEYKFYEDFTIKFNEFRNKNGKSDLIFDPALNELAAKRAIEIESNFSHAGIKQYNLGENIAMLAYSTDTVDDLIALWASSSGHRSNMLSSSYYRTGFAKNGKYAVQIFD